MVCSGRNCNIISAMTYLQSLVEVFNEYFGEITENSIKYN